VESSKNAGGAVPVSAQTLPYPRNGLPAGLYGMVDAGPAEAQAKLEDRARFLVDIGVNVVQLRDKHSGPQSVERMRAWAERCAPFVPLLILNDHAALARELDPTGERIWAHLGQEDGPDPSAPFGRSTHTLAQVTAAGTARYIGFGPIFSTDTKRTGYGPRGTASLEAAVRASAVPVVAIGGITLENIDAVRATGVHGWAVISGFWNHRSDKDALARLR
jgi:thiamine-phosphate diphosphorylase